MPKKGKGKGKKGKGDKKAAVPPPPVTLEEEPLNELSKEFYLIQIKDLEQRLTRYQTKCDGLQLQNDELQKKLSQQLEDQEQMITFLKKKSQEQTESFIDLEERLAALQQSKDAEKESYEQQMSQLKEDSQRALDQAAVENKVLQGQLESLENFRLNKDKLEKELRSKEELIEQQKKDHSEALYRLEKKAVLDKDRMKKEMVAKVNSVAAEFRKVSDIQMAETTKRTIRENVSINQQLTKVSDKTMELITENERLKKKEMRLTTEVEILEAHVKELTTKNVSNHKVMVMMRDKAEHQQQHTSLLQQRVQECQLLEEHAAQAEDEALADDIELKHLRSKLASVEEELVLVKAQLAEALEQLQSQKGLLTKAAGTIQQSLQPASTEWGQSAQRENLLATLLHLLNFKPSTNDRGGHKSELTRSPLPRYKPGDLGLVPVGKHNGQGHTQLPPLSPSGSPLTGSRTKQELAMH